MLVTQESVHFVWIHYFHNLDLLPNVYVVCDVISDSVKHCIVIQAVKRCKKQFGCFLCVYSVKLSVNMFCFSVQKCNFLSVAG